MDYQFARKASPNAGGDISAVTAKQFLTFVNIAYKFLRIL